MTPDPVQIENGRLSTFDQMAVWGMKNPKSKIAACLAIGLVVSALCTIPFLGPLNNLRSVAVFVGTTGLVSVAIRYGVFKLPSKKALTQTAFNACRNKFQLLGTTPGSRIDRQTLLTNLAIAVFYINGLSPDRLVTGYKTSTQKPDPFKEIFSQLQEFVKTLPETEITIIFPMMTAEDAVGGNWPVAEEYLLPYSTEKINANTARGILGQWEQAKDKENAKRAFWPENPTIGSISDAAAQATVDFFLS